MIEWTSIKKLLITEIACKIKQTRFWVVQKVILSQENIRKFTDSLQEVKKTDL